MGDDADRADLEVEAAIAMGIRNASRGVWRLQPTGLCHWCGDAVPRAQAVFCSVECRFDAEKRRAADIRAGRGRRI